MNTESSPFHSTAEEVRYTTDLQRPDETSPLYTEPIRTNHPERYLFRAFSDGGWSTAITPTVHAAQVELPAGTQKTVTLPLNEYINRDGIWLLAFTQEQDKTKISRLEINGPDTAYVIIRNGQKINPFYDIRLYIDSLNRNATMSLTLKNEGDETDKLQVLLKPSCYIEPPVRVTSSIECQSKYPVSRTANYKSTRMHAVHVHVGPTTISCSRSRAPWSAKPSISARACPILPGTASQTEPYRGPTMEGTSPKRFRWTMTDSP